MGSPCGKPRLAKATIPELPDFSPGVWGIKGWKPKRNSGNSAYQRIVLKLS